MQITFSKKQADVITAPFTHTLEVNEGTPRSGKTLSFHFRYARYLVETRDDNHLVIAYNQEQAYRLFYEGDGTGLKYIFSKNGILKQDEQGRYLEITTPKGIRRVFFRGGGKSNDVGAITGMSYGSVVFMEINLLNMGVIQECFRRTFAAKDRLHLADLNPPSPQHPIIKQVFEVQDTKITHWTPDDNPILTDKRKKELKETLSKSDYLYRRDWLGQRVMPQGVIYAAFDTTKNVLPAIVGDPIEMFYSADGGQSDATSCSCYLVTRHEGKYKLLRLASYYHSGAESKEVKAMSIYAREIKAFMGWCKNKFGYHHSEFFIDPACKSLREELELIGVHNSKADNNSKDRPGGIEIGIERAQTIIQELLFFLVDTDKYDHYSFLQEIGMYVRLDNGKPIDKYNHTLDEFRYATNYFYKKYIK